VAFLCLIFTAIAKAQVIEDVLCEGRVFEPKCPTGGLIRIVAASYGNTDGSFCGGNDPEPWAVNCALDVAEPVRQSCQGLPSCSVPVVGGDACVGTSKFLQIIWGCETGGVPQNRVNNKNTNIMVSASSDRANPSTLHGRTLSGSSAYVFLDPAGNRITDVRWFVDQTNMVVTVDDSAPYELYPNRAWDTTQLEDGAHRVVATVTFADGTTGNIDATVTVRNGNQQQNMGIAGAAVERASDTYVETATVNAVGPIVPKEVPWTLFGVSAIVAVILIVVIVAKSRSTSVN